MMEIKELAYQMTAYENGFGIVDFEKGYCDIVVSEYLEGMYDNDIIDLYNDYLYDNGEEIYEEFDNDFFESKFTSPYESARALYFGCVSWSDDFIKINDYGNIVSISINTLIQRAKNDEDFKIWLLYNGYIEEMQDEEYKNKVIKETYKYLKAGY